MNTTDHFTALTTLVAREHHEFDRLLRNIHCGLEKCAAEDWPREQMAPLAAQLRELQTHLTEHFRHEEEGGFLDEACALAPRWQDAANQLRTEHQQMRQRLAHLLNLIEHGRRTKQQCADLREEFEMLLAELVNHERTENQILNRAFNVDMDLM